MIFLDPRAREPGRVMTSPNSGFCELGNGVTCPKFPMNFATFIVTEPECLDGSLCYDIVVANFPSKVWWGAAMF